MEPTPKLCMRLAEPADLDELVRARLMVLRAANGLAPQAPLPQVEAETRRYFEEGLVTGSFAAVLVLAGGELVATGAVSFYEVMPTCHTPTGKKAYIMNMYTAPAWRRRGLATRVLDRLVRECRARGVDTITLEATAMGRPVYERYGFVPMECEMELPAGPDEN
ncbi:GNAT family N-acetyltransferase [Allofournierella sp.]|uniref:GNAT family N-acetyltransferase n=1 Tax=Allofournierella sp. TaxID=1940256 RepID=UPI003AF0F4C8